MTSAQQSANAELLKVKKIYTTYYLWDSWSTIKVKGRKTILIDEPGQTTSFVDVGKIWKSKGVVCVQTFLEDGTERLILLDPELETE